MKVFVIGDTHFPFHSKKAYKKVMALIKKEKPDAIVQIGDLMDQYIFSKYPRSHKIAPKDDVILGLVKAQQMWKDIKKIAPKAKCYQVLGNHDLRLSKRIAERIPELAEIPEFNPLKIYSFPGVKTLKSDRDYLELEGVIYCHGWLSKSIDHAKYFNKPTVHGHRHRPAFEVDGPLWSMDVGHIADEKSLPLSYTASKFSRWRVACGMVIDGKPYPILL